MLGKFKSLFGSKNKPEEAKDQAEVTQEEEQAPSPAEQADTTSASATETPPSDDVETPERQAANSEENKAETAEAEVSPEPEVEQAPAAEPEPVVEVAATEAPAASVAKVEKAEEENKGFFGRIKAGLSRTKASLTNQLGDLFLGKKEIDDELLEDIETLLLTSDVGVAATQTIIDRLTGRVERKQLGDAQALHQALKDELAALLEPVDQPLVAESQQGPFVILMVGVNGVGKTTTIGKLAKRYQKEGKKVMLAAGDTFRAAAVEQLQVWGERNDVPVVAQHTGADSASVLFDALQSAQAKDVDVLIADTAGRLQNKDNLMQELEKVVRVMKKVMPEAPHEVMLVLDAGTGQNALSQAKHFVDAVGVSGVTLTKLDGTAKGGVIFAIAKQMELPIRFIGVGEQVDDLRPFNSKEFVEALFSE